MNLYSHEDELSKQAELAFWTVQERVRAATTDLDHDGMYDLAETVLGKEDDDVVAYKEILAQMDMLHDMVYERNRQSVMVRAQLDLVAAIEYATGITDEFDHRAAANSLLELSQFTGDSAGHHLHYLTKNGE